MKKKKPPILSVERAVEIFSEAISVRRYRYEDGEFFLMGDFLREQSEDLGDYDPYPFRVKTFKTDPKLDFRKKVGVLAFEDSIVFSMDQRFLDKANAGNGLYNTIIAHEIGHLMLRHHEKHAKILNFKMEKLPSGYSILPQNELELEANYAAVFFQCGISLLDDSLTPQRLAKMAHAERSYVEKAYNMVRLPEFKKRLNAPKKQHPRVTL